MLLVVTIFIVLFGIFTDAHKMAKVNPSELSEFWGNFFLFSGFVIILDILAVGFYIAYVIVY